MEKTQLNKWYDRMVEGIASPVYTKDSWKIPNDGAEIWCTAWKRGQTIKPYGDGCHVVVGCSVYHCDELMGILQQNEKDGFTWGVEGVKMTREQCIRGHWETIDY